MESPSNFLKSLRWKPSTASNKLKRRACRWERESVIRWYMTRKVCSYCSILLANNSAWSPSLFLQSKQVLHCRITKSIFSKNSRINLIPRVFSLFKMAAAREKTLAHSRSRVSNEDGDVFKMAATAKRVRRTGYEMLR